MDDADAAMEPGLYWRVKDSFVGYVLGNPDGGMYGDEGIETDGRGTFRFPPASSEQRDDELELRFEGALRFVAHGGMLAVSILRPVVRLHATGGALLIDDGRGGELAIADVAPGEPVDTPDGWRVYPPLRAALTAAGSGLFGGVYGPGEELDPLRIALATAEPVRSGGDAA